MTPDITCSLVERWIYLSLDGELSDDGESHLEAHLDLCSTCRRRMEEIFREQKVLEEELESISGTIDELLGSRIDATKGSRLQGAEALPDIPHRTHTWRRAAPLGIAALLLIGAGVALWATFFQGSGAMPTTDTLARMEWSGNGLEVSAPEGGEKRIHAGSGTDLLRRGEHLFVPAGTEVRITFGDRSQCRVQGVSRVILAAGEDGLLLEMEGGNAIFLIEKQRRGFAVRTTGAWIRVLGTIFTVRHDPLRETTEVTVTEGSVTVARRSRGASRISLSAGGRALVVPGRIEVLQRRSEVAGEAGKKESGAAAGGAASGEKEGGATGDPGPVPPASSGGSTPPGGVPLDLPRERQESRGAGVEGGETDAEPDGDQPPPR